MRQIIWTPKIIYTPRICATCIHSFGQCEDTYKIENGCFRWHETKGLEQKFEFNRKLSEEEEESLIKNMKVSFFELKEYDREIGYYLFTL